jgi:hypothetical protein
VVRTSENKSALRQRLDELARLPNDALETVYAMQQPRRPPGVYWQLRWLAGRILRWLQSLNILPSDPWPARLKHAGQRKNAKPLLVWAVGADRDTIRKACPGLSDLLDTLPGFAPVLVTDVADFAFYSRLAWLVEYLPSIGGDGESYRDRKVRLIARLYRGAPVVPIDLGLLPATERAELWQSMASEGTPRRPL